MVGALRPDPVARTRRLAGRTATRLVVWSTRLVALFAIVSTLLPPTQRALMGEVRDSVGIPPAAGLAGTVTTLVTGVGLFLLATGLSRRKRRAWTLAVGLATVLIVVAVLHTLVTGHGVIAAGTAVALLCALIGTRRWFIARPDPGGTLRALLVLLQFAAAGFGLVWTLLALEHRRLAGGPSAGEMAVHALFSLVGISGPIRFRSLWLDDLTATVGLTFGIAALAVSGYFLLRSPEPEPRLDSAAATRMRSLLGRSGIHDSLGYFALRRDTAAVFSPSGKAAVSYRALAGVALASGDPVGDPEAWPGAIEAYLAECLLHGWVPAVLCCSEQGARAWAKAGLDAIEVGDEAVLDTATFTLDGRAMRGVRQAVHRAHRAGYAVRVRRIQEISPEELDAVARLAATWRRDVVERGFSMALSRVGDANDPEAVLVTAERDGAIRGLLQLVPWGEAGLSLDVMRRDPSADGGLNELMISELMEVAAGLGVRRVSLNFAVFRAALERGERIGAGPVARLWARLLRLASNWWQIDSLYRFNEKFRPQWVPRFLSFPRACDLPRILVSALEAEGFGGRPPAILRLVRR